MSPSRVDEMLVRCHIRPHLGKKRLDRLAVRDVQTWINQIAVSCQCCAQEKDAARPTDRQRCCAFGLCCRHLPSQRTVQAARNVLRAALNQAITDELLTRNAAGLAKVRAPRAPRREPWSVDEARRFLETARHAQDPLYAAYVLVLVLGLRRGEVPGLTWADVRTDATEVHINKQLQRVCGELLHAETKTEGSAATLPLPEICLTALKIRREQQSESKDQAGDVWQDLDLVFTTRWGTPIEPRNSTAAFIPGARAQGCAGSAYTTPAHLRIDPGSPRRPSASGHADPAP